MTKAWELTLKANDKLVLLALADHANDDGECYPSLRKIEAKTGLSKQGLINAIKRLMDLGLIEKQFRTRQDGGQTSNLYTLTLDGVVNEVYPPSQQDVPPQSTRCTPPVNTVYPFNHHNKPSLETSTNSKAQNKFAPPTPEEIASFIKDRNLDVSVESFYLHYESNGWMVGKVKMKSWKHTVLKWHNQNQKPRVK